MTDRPRRRWLLDYQRRWYARRRQRQRAALVLSAVLLAGVIAYCAQVV